MIQLNQLGMAFGERILFWDASFNMTPGNRYGVVGANGSGKTTFMKILSGQLSPVEGSVKIPGQSRVGVLNQNHFEFEQDKILDVVLRGKKELWQLLNEKQELEARSHLTASEGKRLAELELAVSEREGYRAESEAARILVGLGIRNEQLQDCMSTLSGGYKIRVLLGQCLFAQPDILLLDEPNNHLDIYSIAWLGEYLAQYGGIVAVISHDHHFLNQVSTHIIDIDYETLKLYKGNYEQFLMAKELEREQREQEIERQEKKKKELEDFYNRFRAKATKARQAISRKKQILRMEDIVIKRSSRMAPHFRFEQERPSGMQVLGVTDLNKSYGSNRVLKNLSFDVVRGERIAVIGPNGIGKSTLIKILSGDLQPDSGTVLWGHGVMPGYFPQNHKELIPEGSSPYKWLSGAVPNELTSRIRGVLGSMLFSGDDVDKNTAALSGGEAARLIFTRLIMQQPNVLLLDEPTNHLDLESIEALAEVLVAYRGTLIFVSHDRYFVQSVATKILELNYEGFRLYPGRYSDFVAQYGDDHLERGVNWRSRLAIPRENDAQPVEVKLSTQERRQFMKDLSRLEKKVRKHEAAIAAIESKIEEIEKTFAGTEIYAAARQSEFQELLTRKAELEGQLIAEMGDWETEQSAFEEVESRIQSIDDILN